MHCDRVLPSYYVPNSTNYTICTVIQKQPWKACDELWSEKSSTAPFTVGQQMQRKKQRQQIDLLLYLTGQSCNTHLIGNAQCAFVVLSYVFLPINQAAIMHRVSWAYGHLTEKSQGSNQIRVILHALHTRALELQYQKRNSIKITAFNVILKKRDRI